MRLIFMGTPDFALGILQALVGAGHEVVLVVTQPDKPKGRKGVMQCPPVKDFALEEGIPVYQPERIRDRTSVEELKKVPADCIVVAAFGQILPKEILELPKYGCINVHASLLPKYRGSSPIQAAIIHGDKVSGITTMRMDEGLDTGDMIQKIEVALDPFDTYGTLYERLARAGAELIVETLEAMENGSATYTPQNQETATHAPIIKKEMGNIDFSKPAEEIERLVRGLDPWPGTYTRWGDKTLKIRKASVAKESDGTCLPDRGEVPGTVVIAEKNHFLVQAGNGLLALEEVQLEGKKRMDAESFLRGSQIEKGTVLGK